MENSRLEKIIGFETERGSTYKYQGKKVIRNKFNGKEDEFGLNIFIPPYNKLDTETRSKLEELYNIKSEYAYNDFLSNLVYNRSKYRSHVYSFEDRKSRKIYNDEEIKGKEIYFISTYRNNATEMAFFVKVDKQPKEGYFPYQENNFKNGDYMYHLGDRVSKIYSTKI